MIGGERRRPLRPISQESRSIPKRCACRVVRARCCSRYLIDTSAGKVREVMVLCASPQKAFTESAIRTIRTSSSAPWSVTENR